MTDILIPALQDDDTELRMTFRSDPEGHMSDDIYAVGNSGDAKTLLNAFFARSIQGKTFQDSLTIQPFVESVPSISEELVKRGYDIRTLVFSIRKHNADFIQKEKAKETHILKLQENIAKLKLLTQQDVIKGVVVMDEEEMNKINNLLSKMENIINAIKIK